MSSITSQETEQLKKSISIAVSDNLKDRAFDKNIRIDANTVRNVITEYILQKYPYDPSDINRHEWFYQCLGRAVAIVQGWNQNCAHEVKDHATTEESLMAYIQKTYGR